MANKIKISESQYKKLLQLLNETPFDVMVNNSIENGDKLIITHSGGKNRFKVENKDENGLYLTSEDRSQIAQQYKYFMTSESMTNNGTLEFRRVNQKRDPDKVDDLSQWETAHFDGVKNIEVIRQGKGLVDGLKKDYQPNGPEEPEEPENNQEPEENEEEIALSFLETVMDDLHPNKGLKLLVDGHIVEICCLNRDDGQKIQYKIDFTDDSKNQFAALKNYEHYYMTFNKSDNLLKDNIDYVIPLGDDKFKLKFEAINQDESRVVSFNNIQSFAIKDDCENFDEEDDDNQDDNNQDDNNQDDNNQDDNNQDDDNQDDDNQDDGEGYVEVDGDYDADDEDDIDDATEDMTANAKQIYDNIVNDPMMKKAFFNQGSLWKAFVAGLRGKERPKKGIITALNAYYNKRSADLEDKIGKGFKKSGPVDFNPINNIPIEYTPTNGDTPISMVLEVKDNSYYRGRISRHDLHLGNKVISMPMKDSENKPIRDNNKRGTPLAIFLLIDEATQTEDIKECTVYIAHINVNNLQVNYLGVADETALVKFYESEGYTPPKPKSNSNNNPQTNK